MVNIYDDEGNLNLAAAARELNATRGMTNSTSAQATRDILKGAALLDIAVSLRILTDAAAPVLELVEQWGQPIKLTHPTPDEADGDPQREADEPVDVLEAEPGTPVRTIPPEGVAVRYGVLTGMRGESEGTPWLGVLWQGHADEARVFTGRLEVVPVAERVTIDAAANADVDAQLDAAADDLGIVVVENNERDRQNAAELADEENDAEEVDDLDADFAPPVDALKAKRKKGGRK